MENGFSVMISDDALSSLVYSSLSLFGIPVQPEVSTEINTAVVCGEDDIAEAVDTGCGALLVLCRESFRRTSAHRALTEAMGNGYRTLVRPFGITELVRLCRELVGADEALSAAELCAPPKEDEREDTAVRYDKSARCISSAAGSLTLTKREAALFEYLYERRGSVVSRTELVEAVWNGEDNGSNFVEVCASGLRRKLNSVCGDGTLSSVRGRGYILRLGSADRP